MKSDMTERTSFNPAIRPEVAGSLPEIREDPTRFIDNVVFEKQQTPRKGSNPVFVSTAPGRKSIHLRPESAQPAPGVKYRVKIMRDSEPNDPLKGRYEAVIVPSVLELMTEPKWRDLDKQLDAAEIALERLREIEFALGKHGAATAGIPLTKAQLREAAIAQSRHQDQSSVIGKVLDTASVAVRELIKLRSRNYWDAMKKAYGEGGLADQHESLLSEKIELLSDVRHRVFDGSRLTEVAGEALDQVRGEMEKTNAELAALPLQSPESFVAVHGHELLEMQQSVKERGLVMTPYVKQMAERVYENAVLGQPTLIHGHLGSGKTELALLVARQFYKDGEPLIISGSAHTTPEEFFGYQTLKVSEIAAKEGEALKQNVNNEIEAWKLTNADRLGKLSDQERVQETQMQYDLILQVALRSKGVGTLTENIIGPIHRAMREGRPVIIDEINSIPHEVLIALNYALGKRPGQIVENIKGEQFPVKAGYCVIGTANLNSNELHHYVGRKDLDPAFMDRFYKMEYDYLPQFTDRPLEDEIKPEDALNGRQLYMAMLSLLMDERGTTNMPEGSDKKLWALAKLARVTQDVFAGKDVKSDFYFKQGGKMLRPQLPTPMSMRSIRRVLDAWKASNYEVELDWFVWESYIKSSYSEPIDRAYLYQLFRSNAFFDTPGWKNNSELNFGQDNILADFTIAAPKNPAKPRTLTTLKGTVQMAFGKGPARAKSDWPTSGGEAVVEQPKSPQEELRDAGVEYADIVLGVDVKSSWDTWRDKLKEQNIEITFDDPIADEIREVGPVDVTLLRTTREVSQEEMKQYLLHNGFRGIVMDELVALRGLKPEMDKEALVALSSYFRGGGMYRAVVFIEDGQALMVAMDQMIPAGVIIPVVEKVEKIRFDGELLPKDEVGLLTEKLPAWLGFTPRNGAHYVLKDGHIRELNFQNVGIKDLVGLRTNGGIGPIYIPAEVTKLDLTGTPLATDAALREHYKAIKMELSNTRPGLVVIP
jgi:MoxR-like ATPase